MSGFRTEMELVGDREIVITRTFRARAGVVFDAWTSAEHVRAWWAPASRGLTMAVCEAEVRPGGSYRYVLARNAERIAFSGRYIEVERPVRLVYTQRFEPMPGEITITVTFAEREGSTTLTAREVYPSKQVRDAALATGMEEGMRETFELLAELVVKLG
jgi:uncharacterized protein YndB with AHSA1/START domain